MMKRGFMVAAALAYSCAAPPRSNEPVPLPRTTSTEGGSEAARADASTAASQSLDSGEIWGCIAESQARFATTASGAQCVTMDTMRKTPPSRGTRVQVAGRLSSQIGQPSTLAPLDGRGAPIELEFRGAAARCAGAADAVVEGELGDAFHPSTDGWNRHLVDVVVVGQLGSQRACR